MGIKGLLQFLSGAQRDVNISSFRGQTAAVDAYCWLHKGAYSCAMQLVMKTEKCENLPFIRYCMKRINLLRQHDITPIVVFDGANLPMKRHTEKERRERRQSYLQKGKLLLKDGKQSEAFDCFQKCVDVSPEMALAFIKELRNHQIQVIVAPFEADAQLAYLMKERIADIVITEDSDLLTFGCQRVLYKMNDNGDGKLIELENVGKSIKSLIGFTPESFRHMCILCGCDYLPSIHGIGPGRASKLMRKFNKNPYNVIKSLKREGKGNVPLGYEEDFRRADETFLYQLVFDPRTQKQVRLNTPPPEFDLSRLESVGIQSSPSKQVGLARGNINPLTMEIMDTYSPSKPSSSSVQKPPHISSSSWSGSVMGCVNKPYPIKKQTQITVSKSAKKNYKPPKTLNSSEDDDTTHDELLILMYGGGKETTPPQLSDLDDMQTSQTGMTSGKQLSSHNKFANTIVKSRYFGMNPFSSSPDKANGVCGTGDSCLEPIVKREEQKDEECDSQHISCNHPNESHDYETVSHDYTTISGDMSVGVSSYDSGLGESITPSCSNEPSSCSLSVDVVKKRLNFDFSYKGRDTKRIKLDEYYENNDEDVIESDKKEDTPYILGDVPSTSSIISDNDKYDDSTDLTIDEEQDIVSMPTTKMTSSKRTRSTNDSISKKGGASIRIGLSKPFKSTFKHPRLRNSVTNSISSYFKRDK